jgi:manganese-dependent inorganic pyrophosphatase
MVKKRGKRSSRSKSKKEDIYVIGHINPDTDSVCSAIGYAHFLSARHKHHVHAARAGKINPETAFVLKYFKARTPQLITNGKGKNLILMDHNEINLAVKNIRQANILEIIDHHRIGDVETIHPIPFENEPCGSTSSIVADRYSWFRIPLSKKVAGVLLSGILSDTLLLKSPTTTKKERVWARRLARAAGVDVKKYGRQLLQAGCDVINKSPGVIVTADMKCYGRYKGKYKKLCIAQVSVADSRVALHKRQELLAAMRKVRKKEKLHYLFLMVTNIVSMHTDLLVVAGNSAGLKKVEKVFGKKIHNNTLVLQKTVSRKLQVQPKVLKLL